jgi:archaellum biogenesis protein FlaJ (TadC family)
MRSDFGGESVDEKAGEEEISHFPPFIRALGNSASMGGKNRSAFRTDLG